jgi:hypothetical protein
MKFVERKKWTGRSALFPRSSENAAEDLTMISLTDTKTRLPTPDGLADWEVRLAAHRRDIDLFERLFSTWTRGRRRHTEDVHQSLDAIDAQLARLERTVTMTAAA